MAEPLIVKVDGNDGTAFVAEVAPQKPFPALLYRMDSGKQKETHTGKWNGYMVELDATVDLPYPHTVQPWLEETYLKLENLIRDEAKRRAENKAK